jgi:hypothetical protein
MQERILPFAEEDRRSGVERLKVNDSIAYSALAYDFVDSLGDIEQLHTIDCDPVDDAVEDLVSRREHG